MAHPDHAAMLLLLKKKAPGAAPEDGPIGADDGEAEGPATDPLHDAAEEVKQSLAGKGTPEELASALGDFIDLYMSKKHDEPAEEAPSDGE